MKGYPKHLNTKNDYLYIREHFPKEKWAPDFQVLLDTQIQWLNIGKLEKQTDGITDKTHEVRTVDITDKTSEHYQYEYKNDPNCKLLKIGFTRSEISKVLSEGKQLKDVRLATC